MKRVGFIINSRVPDATSLFHGGLLPHHLLWGWDDSASPMSFMRFHWIARELLRTRSPFHYELYRPWRRYDSVVFLKSMGEHCVALARRLKAAGTTVIFEANVDYYTPRESQNHLAEMALTSRQQANAIEITETADIVIGTSRHLTKVCQAYNKRAYWVPDNVCLDLVPAESHSSRSSEEVLQLWWSGVAAKAFEFLLIAGVLKAFRDRVHLHLVTDDWQKGRSSWSEEQRQSMDDLLVTVPHTLHDFGSIGNLLALYSQGPGLILSPRFLDNPYNLGHTEWKITLGMACGLPAVASPLPSYLDVAERAQPGAIHICRTDEEWAACFDGGLDFASAAARRVVRDHYSTAVVAPMHVEAISGK